MSRRAVRAGFTLLELTVVLLIVGLLVALAVPALDAVLGPRDRVPAVGLVVATLHAAREEAAITGRTRGIWLAAGGSRLEGEAGAVDLPADARVEADADGRTIEFLPTGLASPATWRVIGRDGTAVVVVAPLTGTIDVRDEDPRR